MTIKTARDQCRERLEQLARHQAETDKLAADVVAHVLRMELVHAPDVVVASVFNGRRKGVNAERHTKLPALLELLHAATLFCIDPRPDRAEPLWVALARFRCECGKYPVEGSIHGYWCVRCCDYEWDSWEDFLEWRDAQDAKAQAPIQS